MLTTQEKLFINDLKTLYSKHGMVLVPTYEHKPSAHDPMRIVPFDDFWDDYFATRVIGGSVVDTGVEAEPL